MQISKLFIIFLMIPVLLFSCKLTKKEMDELNAGFVRKSGIEKWFVQIRPRAG